MPPTKVYPECDAVVPITLKVCTSCQHDVIQLITDDDEYTTIHHFTIVGVSELDHHRSCLLGHARVEPRTPPDGKCTRSDCQMLQVFDMCQEQVSAHILLRYLNDDGKEADILCSAYGDIVYHLANKPTSHQLISDWKEHYHFCTASNVSLYHLIFPNS